jgi:hypothetical protein
LDRLSCFSQRVERLRMHIMTVWKVWAKLH